MKVQFSPPDMTDSEIKGAIDAIRSGWITTGPRTKEFENKIAAYVGVNKAVCLNSQTACGEMALRLLGIGEGDEVIVSSYTYTASASIICHVGAKPIFVDIQKGSLQDGTLQMDYDAVKKAINERTKAIIPVDLGGVPCDYDQIFEIVNRKKDIFKPVNAVQEAIGRVAIIADTAHAFGAAWHDKKCGAIADFSCFSFHAVKNLTTAEGGALTWRTIPGIDDETLYYQAQLYSLHGQSKDAFAKTNLGSWEYDIAGPWYKCNMTDITAAIGIAQFGRYPELLRKRREIIERYDAAFKPLGIEVLPHFTEDWQSSGHLYITRVPGIGADERQEIITKMAEVGIATNVHYKPLPMMTAYKNMGWRIENFPNSYEHFVNEITLPLHTKMTDEMVSYVEENFRRIVMEYIK